MRFNSIKRVGVSGLARILLAGLVLATASGCIAVDTTRGHLRSGKNAAKDFFNPGWEKKRTRQAQYEKMIASERVYQDVAGRLTAEGSEMGHLIGPSEEFLFTEALEDYIDNVESYMDTGNLGTEYTQKLKSIVVGGRAHLRRMAADSDYKYGKTPAVSNK